MNRQTLLTLSLLAIASAGCGEATKSVTPDELRISQNFARGPMGVIVRVKSNPRFVAESHGVSPRFIYSHVFKGFAARVSDNALAGLLRNPNVLSVTPDAVVSVASVPTHLDRINQRTPILDGLYSSENDGAGVTIYIPDSGIRPTHSEFGGRASLGADFIGGDGSDCTSHGTFVAGIAGGATYGVAKQASLVALKVFGCSRDTFTSIVVASLDWIAANAVRPAVVNLSMAGLADQSMDDAVAYLVSIGIPVVVSAGNSNADACGYSPARAASAITAGGTMIGTLKGKTVDLRYDQSNYGDCLDINAPAHATSAWASGDDATSGGTGTSVSAPIVAGVAAMILSSNPFFSPAQVDSAIKARSTKGVVKQSLSMADDLVYSLGDVGAEPCGRNRC